MRELRISVAVITLCLISIGIIMIYSSSFAFALEEMGDAAYFIKRHLLFLFFGLMATISVMMIDYRDLKKMAKPLLVLSFLLLIFVLLPSVGQTSYGARRWFKFGPFHFQPSEFAKLAVLIYAADFLSRKKNKISSFWFGFLPVMLVTGAISLLIVKQPDLGNALLVANIVLIMIFIAGAQIKHMVILCLMSLPVLYALVFRVPYRLARITAFMDPWQDSQGVGFQLTQSQIALGSGGMWGVGLGKSVQKLFYLPAAHTDFIFSIIGEELGLVRTIGVVLLFMAFIFQGARIAKRTEEPFGYFLSIGILAMLGLQAVVNIGVSIGAFPTKGLPLPFISYGGSALVFQLMAVGLLLNISRTQDVHS